MFFLFNFKHITNQDEVKKNFLEEKIPPVLKFKANNIFIQGLLSHNSKAKYDHFFKAKHILDTIKKKFPKGKLILQKVEESRVSAILNYFSHFFVASVLICLLYFYKECTRIMRLISEEEWRTTSAWRLWATTWQKTRSMAK